MPADAFAAETDRLYAQMKPLYEQLHCYTRRKLNKIYGDKVVPKTGPIPAHLLGNMWAQSWGWLYKELEPYRAKRRVDVTERSRSRPYDEKKMVKIAEAFYTSLGFRPLPPRSGSARCSRSRPARRRGLLTRARGTSTYAQRPPHQDVHPAHHEELPRHPSTRLGHNYYHAAYYKARFCSRPARTTASTRRSATRRAVDDADVPRKEKGLLDSGRQERQGHDQPADEHRARRSRSCRSASSSTSGGGTCSPGRSSPSSTTRTGGSSAGSTRASPPPARARPTSIRARSITSPATSSLHAVLPRRGAPVPVPPRAVQGAGDTGPLHECSIYNNKVAGERRTGRCCRPARASRGRTRCSPHRPARDGRDRDPRLLRAAQDLARDAEQGPDLRLVGTRR